jgi:hypothetical protein
LPVFVPALALVNAVGGPRKSGSLAVVERAGVHRKKIQAICNGKIAPSAM